MATDAATSQTDKLEIQELIRMERYWRDTARWDRLAAAYTPDSRVRTTWFDGSGPDFAEASREMANRGRLSRHLITPTYVRVEGDRGLVDSYGEIHNRERVAEVEVDILMYCRFFSRVARTDDGWRLASFDGIYLKDQLTPVDPGAELPIDWAEVERFPRPSYRVWAYTLSLKGYEIGAEELGEDRPEKIEEFMRAAEGWLHEGS
ncbi:MAG TPA: nuclear transport factor 2 family protein [Solirubrobacterales bacterium]|nr:nuclear transport factor 2 family protein [Solirubrobacterales bacterium]